MKVKHLIDYWRLWLVVGLIVALPIVLVARASDLLVLSGGDHGVSLKQEGDNRTIKSTELVAYRGLITDREGELLAVSTPMTSLYADPSLIKAQDVPNIARALGWKEAKLNKKLALYKNKRFMYLQNLLPPQQAQAILDKRFAGIYGRKEYKRYYPAGEVTSHLLGMTSVDEQGIEGVELSYNDWLDGEPGKKKVLKDLHKKIVKDLGVIKAPRPGKDLQLTIDLKLQYLAYKELKHAIAKQGAKSGWLITVDAASGEILAMVNQPSYNPNDRSTIASYDVVRNRVVTDVFEPGSTVKPFTIAAALETQRFSVHDKIDTSPGYIRVNRKTILDPVNYGVMDLKKILKKSSQVGTTKIALQMQAQEIRDTFFKMGFGQAVGIGFPGERNGTLPMRNKWTDIEKANLAFGYGLSVNAMQLAQAYLTLANEGQYIPVTLLKQSEPAQPVQVLDKQVAKQVVSMLASVTRSGGTATTAAIDDYEVAGKTGTAHKVSGRGGYAEDKYMAFFAGFAPVNSPRLITVVVVDEPPADGEYSGGKAAAPIFASVMEKSLKALNVPPANTSHYLADLSDRVGGGQ